MKRNLLLAAAVLVVVVAVALSRRRPAPLPPIASRPVVVEAAAPTRGPIAETTVVGGTLQAAGRVELTAQLPSRVLSVPVAEGTTVAAGAIVVQLDDAEIRDQIARSAAGVAAARALLAKARAGREAARQASGATRRRAAGSTRAAEAAAEQAGLGVELSRAEAAADLAKAKAGLAAAEANRNQAERAVELARTQAAADVATAAAGVSAAEANLARARAGAKVAGEAASAELDRAKAGLAAAEADLARVRAGATPQDIAAAQAQVDQARAGRDHAQRELADLDYLHRNGGIAGDKVDGARTQLAVAQAQLDAAAAQLAKARAGATPEQLRAAEAQRDQARAGVAAATAALGRQQVASAEVAAAEADLARARAGLSAAEKTRDDRVAVAQAQSTAAQGAVDQARAGVEAATAGTRRVDLRRAERRAAGANVEAARAGEDEAAASRFQADLAAADIAAAQAGLVEALAQERIARQQLQRTAVTTPVAGVVARLSVQPGDTILPGTPLAVIETAAASELEALASAEQRGRLQPGQVARVGVAGGQRIATGSVRDVSDVAEPDGRTFKVRILLPASGLSPGQHATAEIITASESHALLVPAAALQDAGEQAGHVYLIQGQQAVRRQVTLGLRAAEQVQVVEGLTDTDQVVTVGAGALYDGAPITLRQESAR